MIPVRHDILKDKTILFSNSWKSRVFRASYKQNQKNNNNILPSIPRFDDIVNLYLDTWYDIVVEKNWGSEGGPPDRAFIMDYIANTYTRKANRYLRR